MLADDVSTVNEQIKYKIKSSSLDREGFVTV